MKLPFVEKMAQRFTKSASEQAKKEVKKTAIDLIPTLLTIGGMIFGITVFSHKGSHGITRHNDRPFANSTKITTNNYFFNDVSDDIIKKILEENR